MNFLGALIHNFPKRNLRVLSVGLLTALPKHTGMLVVISAFMILQVIHVCKSFALRHTCTRRTEVMFSRMPGRKSPGLRSRATQSLWKAVCLTLTENGLRLGKNRCLDQWIHIVLRRFSRTSILFWNTIKASTLVFWRNFKIETCFVFSELKGIHLCWVFSLCVKNLVSCGWSLIPGSWTNTSMIPPTQIFPQLMLLQDLKHARMRVSMLGLVIYQTLFTLFQFLMTLRGDLPCRQLRLESLAWPTLDGEIVGPGTKLCPYLTVLPMGWSWALHFCQAVMMNAIEISGFSGDRIVGDKRAPVHLSDLHTTCAAGYVDNFLVLGGDRDAVDSGLQKISSTLRGFGLTVHEEVPASLRCDFVGLSFNGEQGLISIKPSRIHKLSRAIHELLLRNFCTGKLLQLILGHVTWALMCRREALSAINAGYAFVNMHYNTPTRLWPKLRQELFWIADILPLCRVRVNVGWSSDVCASDSSPFGYGICQRHINPDIARAVGRQSERWRFRFEDAVDARKHAADSVGITSLDEKPQNVSDFKLDEVINELNSGNNFHEVPHSILKKDDWTVVWSHPWNHEGNILETEALSLVWAIEHW